MNKVLILIEALSKEFGKENVKIRSQYHLQVELNKKLNDIWITKDQDVKLKLYGQRNVIENISLIQIIQKLKSNKKTEIDQMKEVLDFSNFIKQCEQTVKENRLSTAIFTDAGFKDGQARIAAVFIDPIGNIDAKSRLVQAEDNNFAEMKAIRLGMSFHPSVIIYNDNETAVNSMNVMEPDLKRVRWIPRHQNRVSDKIGNMRK
jgi:hypothetical protein